MERQCLKCRQKKPIESFLKTNSKFFPGHYSYICVDCLSAMVDGQNLDEVDALCRHHDIPFNPNLWTSFYESNPKNTLRAYLDIIGDSTYDCQTWADESRKWGEIRADGGIDDEIRTLSASKLRKLRNEWGPEYSDAELMWLEDYYQAILQTQNVSTPILQRSAHLLCETELCIHNGIRTGLDVKRLMDTRDNLIKQSNFTASNSKNSANFDSTGELILYYAKKGWHPTYCVVAKDEADFLMENVHEYLDHLYHNEGNFNELVEEEQEKRYNLAARLNENEMYHGSSEVTHTEEPIEYEDAEQLESEISDWSTGN